MEKIILDVTCGGRKMWMDKRNVFTVYSDIRTATTGILKHRKNFKVEPDVIEDYRCLSFKDESFKLVVFDPPHLLDLSPKSWIYKKYGSLFENWQDDLRAGFSKCMRVLEPGGVLIFKWSEGDISLNKLLDIIPFKPLIGSRNGKNGNTIWLVFMKYPGSL